MSDPTCAAPKKKVHTSTRFMLWARRLSEHYYIVLVSAALLTVLSVVIAKRLRFDSDLANLLPEHHPDLQALRRIQARYATDTGFMVLISRNYVFTADEGGTIHMHDGKRWVRTPTGLPLYALWGVAADDVWAAGAGGRLHHFDGKRWQAANSPTRAALRGLWGDGPQKLFAAGADGTLLAYNGRAWSPLPSGTRRHLRAIAGSGAELYAVGDGGTILRLAPEGVQPEEAPSSADLLGVAAFGGGEAVAVGASGTFLVRREGVWRTVPTGVTTPLRAVFGTRPGNVQAVGDGGVALRFDGKRLRPQTSTTSVDLTAVHGVAHDDVWAAGAGCTVKRYDWEWYPGPYEDPVLMKSKGYRPCVAKLTAVWRPPANLEGAKALAPQIARALAKSSGISRVDYLKPVKFFWDRALYFSSVEDLERLRDQIEENLERETAKGTGMFVDFEEQRTKESKQELLSMFKKYQEQIASFGASEYYVHPDGTSLGVVVYPKTGVSDFANLRRVWAEIEHVVSRIDPKQVDPLLRVDVSGDGVGKIREYDATVEDVFGYTWLPIIVIIGLMLIFFRRVSMVFFVAVPMCMSIAWTFAVAAIVVGQLNVVTGFLFAVLFGLGIDYGLQLFARYREGRSAGLPVGEAMNHVVCDTGRATLTSGLTTAAGLLTLTVTDFRGFSEFGLIAGIGIVLALFGYILVLPALILLAERWRLLRIPVSQTTATDDRAGPRQEPFALPRLVLVLSTIAVALSIYGATRVGFEYDNRKLRASLPKDEVLRRARPSFGRSFTPTLLVADSRDELEAAVSSIQHTSERLGRRSAVKNVITILDLVPKRQREKRAVLDDLAELLNDKRWNLVSDKTKEKVKLERLRELVRAQPFTLEELPAEARRGFKGPGFGNIWLAMVFHRVALGHTKEARILKDQVGSFAGTPWVNLGNLLPKGVRVLAEGNRAEIVCPAPKPVCVKAVMDRLRSLRHGGGRVFTHVAETREAYRTKLAVPGGLQGDVLAVSNPGYLIRAAAGKQTIQPSGMFHVSSGELVLAEVVDLLLHDGRIAFVLASLATFFTVLFDFRSLRLAMLACLPLTVGMLWTFGIMALTGMKLNLFNFVMLPTLLGIGEDYGVHYVHRYRSEGPGSLGRVMRSLYWVIFFCSATAVVGFGNVVLASHPGLKSLGQLAIVGLACIFFSSTYALPSLLYVVERIRGVPAKAPPPEAPRVMLYAMSYCPSCKMARRFLVDRGVTFSYTELDTLPLDERRRLAQEIVATTGADTLPVTRFGASHVVGFDPVKLGRAVQELEGKGDAERRERR